MSRRSTPCRPWTHAELQHLQTLARNKVRYRKIAMILGRSENAISTKLSILGMTAANGPKPTEEEWWYHVYAVAKAHDVKASQVVKPSSAFANARLRHEVFANLMDAGFGLSGIAAVSGYDHSTIKKGAQRVRQERAAQAAE